MRNLKKRKNTEKIHYVKKKERKNTQLVNNLSSATPVANP